MNNLSDAEAEAAETQVWIEFALQCGYIEQVTAETLDEAYDNIRGKIVKMITRPEQWTIR